MKTATLTTKGVVDEKTEAPAGKRRLQSVGGAEMTASLGGSPALQREW